MLRRTVFSFAILSMPLFVLSVAAWIRSEFHRDAWAEVRSSPGSSIQSLSGRLCFCSMRAIGTWPVTQDFGDPHLPWVPAPFQLGVQVESHPLPLRWMSQMSDARIPTYSYRVDLPPAGLTNMFGFQITHDSLPAANGTGWALEVASVPYWSIVLLFAIGPVWWILHWIFEKKRAVVGHCSKCGYDLRATPDRCPECGTPVALIR